MKVEIVSEEVIKECVLRLTPKEYRDLLVLFSAPKDALGEVFSEGAKANTIHGGAFTTDRDGVIAAFKKAGKDYNAGRTA
jgi:hypothetical protein